MIKIPPIDRGSPPTPEIKENEEPKEAHMSLSDDVLHEKRPQMIIHVVFINNSFS